MTKAVTWASHTDAALESCGGPTLRVPDSEGLGQGPQYASLTGSHVMLPTLRITMAQERKPQQGNRSQTKMSVTYCPLCLWLACNYF